MLDAQLGFESIAKTLLLPDMNLRDSVRMTVLMYAAAAGHPNIVSLLRDRSGAR
jgi:ankyrin repeat protein